MVLQTSQQRIYEEAYRAAGDSFGFPDRKITDGATVKGKKILVIGGGRSNDVWCLTPDNLVINVDYAFSGLRAGLQNGVWGIAANLNAQFDLPFVHHSFDIIVCKDILEHLLEPLAILHEVRRVLRDDGYVIISVPNHFYLTMRIRMLFGANILWKSLGHDHSKDYDEWDYMHIRFFSYGGFRRLLKAAAFRPAMFFWDFGALAHYDNPDMWIEPQLWKRANGLPVSRAGKFGVYVIRPLWRVFNTVLPRPVRRAIVSLAPGLLSAGFYVRCVKEREPGTRVKKETGAA